MSRQQLEYGDFQTPLALARQVCQYVRAAGLQPRTVVEPTCGQGTFLQAATEAFPTTELAVGLEINPAHLAAARQRLASAARATRLTQGDFFATNWTALLADAPQPTLVIGNPPWVTNAALGAMRSGNLPTKSNAAGTRGIDAVTGSSNFDVSEFMILQLLQWLAVHRGMLAVLCKTSVARRVLKNCWMQEQPFDRYQIQRIDAAEHFGAAVDACLLLISNLGGSPQYDCPLGYLGSNRSSSRIGWRAGCLVANAADYDRYQAYYGLSDFRWRSGIKHDCADVIELHRTKGEFWNGLQERVDVERRHLFPLLKSSSLLNGQSNPRNRWMLVTQRRVGDATDALQQTAPKTWRYLNAHAERLDRRASRIYAGRPRFSIFGVGDYTFQSWKVAISGFAKRVRFELIRPKYRKPVVFDDTCYFLGMDNERKAAEICQALNSPPVRAALEALIFPDAKRPITSETLNQINISGVIAHCR